jgi:hypothetical protein
MKLWSSEKGFSIVFFHSISLLFASPQNPCH